MFRLPLINYFIVTTTRDRVPSTFQYFTREWTSLYETFGAILQFPTSIIDIVSTREHRVACRTAGLGRVCFAIIKPDVLDTIEPVPFMVLVTPAGSDEAGRVFCRKYHDSPILQLFDSPHAGEQGLQTASELTFAEWYKVSVAHFTTNDGESARVFADVTPSTFRHTAKQHPLERAHLHLSQFTMANDLQLLSLGHPNWDRTTEQADSEAELLPLIERSFNQAVAFRDCHYDRRMNPFGVTELLLVSPGMVQSLPLVMARDNHGADDLARRTYHELRRFSGFVLPETLVGESVRPPRHSPAWRLLAARTSEMQATLQAAAIEAVGQMIPTVPLLRNADRAIPLLSALTDSIRRSRAGWRRQACSTARTLGDGLAETIPDYALRRLESARATVKVYSDHPVELAQIAGRPLSLRHAVVRLPVTPGFVLERLAQFCAPIFLTPSDFKNVLVLRGTLPDDPVFGQIDHFCTKVAVSCGATLTIVDVRSPEDMARALNDFSGALAIVDTHGLHPDRAPGKLGFGGAVANPLESKDRFKAPPIVFLAACDTHSLDRGQETVGLGFLVAGARTVVATLAPVEGLASAVFLAEVLLQIFRFVPILPRPIRWSELFWMAACASHAAEAAFNIRAERLLALSPDDVQRANIVAMKALAMFQQDWLEQVWADIAAAGRTNIETVKGMWNDVAYMTNAILHVQLGHADSIFLVPSDDWLEKLDPLNAPKL